MKAETKNSIQIGVWSAIGGAIITMVIGFSVGGWVFGSTSIELSETTARKAIVERLSTICVGQFNLDSEKEKKMKELNDTKSWNRNEYVKDQGWATMPFEKESDSVIVARCTSLIMKMNQ